MSEQREFWICPKCGTQLDISRLSFFAEVVCPQCGTHATVHGMLANYKVESVLGIGGMSVVFQARDLVLGRPLAIKVLNDTYRDAPDRIAGFGNECAIMAKVRHENVVSVYSAGWARGQFFIAMELVEGRNLELMVAEQGSLPPMEAVEIIRQVAQGLQAAHAAGILHRDVKPGNVLISTAGQAKVLDFGLSLDEKSEMNSDEIIWATPYYVPPETLRREEENVRADIYALGMTLRNLLTGEDKLAGNPQTVPDMLVAKKVLPALSTLAPKLDAELCELVDRMSAFAPEKRPADYAEVLKAVEAVQKKMRDDADPQVQARRRSRRLYLACGSLSSVLAGLLGGFAVAWMTPSEQIYEVLYADQAQWPEIAAYNEALAALAAGDRAAAGEKLGALLAEDMDPAVSAPATLLRVAVDVLDDKSAANGYNRFRDVAARVDDVSPAGQAGFDKLVALVSALHRDVSAAEPLAAGLEPPLLRAAAHLLVADAYVQKGDAARADAQLSLAAEASEPMKAQLEAYRETAPRRAARVRLAQLKDLFYTGRYAEAVEGLPGVLEMKLSPAEKAELTVLHEASGMMQAVLETLARHGRAVSAGMNPADLQASARGLGGNDKVAREFYCIALLLSGDYDAAFRENPYTADDAEQTPFAIMMRDWKARLGW